jgi:hypothetical protein
MATGLPLGNDGNGAWAVVAVDRGERRLRVAASRILIRNGTSGV